MSAPDLNQGPSWLKKSTLPIGTTDKKFFICCNLKNLIKSIEIGNKLVLIIVQNIKIQQWS
jgi:tRNA-binding EMAP/Myf-like protein